MKHLFLILGISMLYFSLSAQTDEKKTLKFSETNPDFYNVQEIEGIATHDLLVTNLGENEVKLIGFTSENPAARYEWKQNVLKKYDKMHIKVLLDPKGMRYSFRIPTTILTLVGKDTVKYDIRLNGYVHPTPSPKEHPKGK